MSLLTEELKKLGFQAYIQNTGKYTSLIIEGKRQAGDTIYTYDFYKVSFYKNCLWRAFNSFSIIKACKKLYLLSRKIS